MRKRFFNFMLLFLFLISIISFASSSRESDLKELYFKINLRDKVSYEVFKNAMEGYEKIDEKKRNILTIIDYTKPSTQQRFFVIDVKNNKLLYETYVAHGMKTGDLFAEEFSNKVDSKQSSIGFFLTDNAYVGSNGYSLRLDGLESGINDNARKRAIVIHAANYVNYNYIKANGRLGRSWGCPALPENLTGEIIDTIKEGSVLFVNGNDTDYINKSKFI